MAKNFITDGNRITYLNKTGEDIVSGQPVAIERLVGIALGDIAKDESGTLALSGVWEVKSTDGEIKQGARLYFKDGKADPEPESIVNCPMFGYCFMPKPAGLETVQVRLRG